MYLIWFFLKKQISTKKEHICSSTVQCIPPKKKKIITCFSWGSITSPEVERGPSKRNHPPRAQACLPKRYLRSYKNWKLLGGSKGHRPKGSQDSLLVGTLKHPAHKPCTRPPCRITCKRCYEGWVAPRHVVPDSMPSTGCVDWNNSNQY